MKRILASILCTALLVLGAIGFTACGKKSLYNIDFSGNIEGENYSVAGSTWEQSSEDGFDAVYTLKGTIAYDKTTADKMGYTDGRVHFVLIKFTSDEVTKLSYNKEE